VVTWRGRLIGERYGQGITMHTPLESWSMGKSVTATLMGILIKEGVYDLLRGLPIPRTEASILSGPFRRSRHRVLTHPSSDAS
jgi:hypothetical protein